MLEKNFRNNQIKKVLTHVSKPVLPAVGGQGGLRNLGAELTLLQPGVADYAHHITASPPGFENPAAAL